MLLFAVLFLPGGEAFRRRFAAAIALFRSIRSRISSVNPSGPSSGSGDGGDLALRFCDTLRVLGLLVVDLDADVAVSAIASDLEHPRSKALKASRAATALSLGISLTLSLL